MGCNLPNPPFTLTPFLDTLMCLSERTVGIGGFKSPFTVKKRYRQEEHKKLQKPSLGRFGADRPGTPTALASSRVFPLNPARSPIVRVRVEANQSTSSSQFRQPPPVPASPRSAQGAQVSCHRLASSASRGSSSKRSLRVSSERRRPSRNCPALSASHYTQD